MPNNIVGNIPEFTQDGTVPQEPVAEEVKQDEVVQPELPPETDTPIPPVDKPLSRDAKEEYSEDAVQAAVKGLKDERVKLLKEISELKGQKRQIKQDKLDIIQDRIDELKDLHPDDVSTIERVLKAKGLMTKDEANKMFYESVKDEELNKFLDVYPEYKPENDPGDANWTALQRELGFYRMPENPRQVREILERAHRSIVRVPNDLNIPVRKRQVEVASAGTGGMQRSSPTGNKLSPEKRAMLKGFTEEEIQAMEQKL